MSHRALTDCHFPHSSSGGPRAGAPVTFCPGPAESELYFGHERCPFLACTGPEKLLYVLEIVLFSFTLRKGKHQVTVPTGTLRNVQGRGRPKLGSPNP